MAKKEQNTNCLDGMKCPSCGSLEPFEIHANATFEVFDSGTEDYYAVAWGSDSVCLCNRCGLEGTVADFQLEGDGNA